MAGHWLTFHEAKDCFDEQIILHGPNAFGPNYGFAQLYSGPPRDTVFSATIGIAETNQDKAKRQASANNAILLDNTPIGNYATIFQGIRKICDRSDYDAAFDLICRGELNVAYSKAMDTGDVRVFQDFLERGEFYMVERELTLTAAGKSVPSMFKMTPVERADWRRHQMQKFVLGTLGKILEDLDVLLPYAPSSPVFVRGASPKPA